MSTNPDIEEHASWLGVWTILDVDSIGPQAAPGGQRLHPYPPCKSKQNRSHWSGQSAHLKRDILLKKNQKTSSVYLGRSDGSENKSGNVGLYSKKPDRVAPGDRRWSHRSGGSSVEEEINGESGLVEDRLLPIHQNPISVEWSGEATSVVDKWELSFSVVWNAAIEACTWLVTAFWALIKIFPIWFQWSWW